MPLSYSITIDYNGAQWGHDALQCELCATIYRAEVTMELSVFPDVGSTAIEAGPKQGNCLCHLCGQEVSVKKMLHHVGHQIIACSK